MSSVFEGSDEAGARTRSVNHSSSHFRQGPRTTAPNRRSIPFFAAAWLIAAMAACGMAWWSGRFQGVGGERLAAGALFWLPVWTLIVTGLAWAMVRRSRSRTDQQVRRQLDRLAFHDDLTGLRNRAAIHRDVEAAVHRAGAGDSDNRFAVFYFDYDRFKLINDSLGHDQGDRLLQQIAVRIGGMAREMNRNESAGACAAAARSGGDAFVLLIEGPRAIDQVEALTDRLRAALTEPYDLPNRRMQGSVSIGVTTSALDYRNADDVLRDAEIAMYAAKADGRAGCRMFDRAMHERLCDRLALEHDLHDALGRDELFIELQPIVELASRRTVGFEALVRWQHPVRGRVRPDQFIDIAEESGLIVPIGRWVLREACRQLGAIRASVPGSHRLTMNVNVSRQQLTDPSLVADVERALTEYDISPDDLHLEITESTIMDDASTAIRTLNALKRVGVLIAMDDFGTGTSSLSCLHEFPLDVLKIDRRFVANLSDRPDYMSVVQAIVVLAHNVGATVVAEGLETTEQIATLLALECDLGQGYFFAKPLPLDAAVHFLCGRATVSAAAG